MANGLYMNYKLQMLGAAAAAHTLPDMDTHTIKVGIISGSDYTEDLATDADWDDVGLYTVNASYGGEINQTLENIDLTTTPGTVDNTANITFAAVDIDTAKVVDAIIHYYDTTVITTSPLITFHDGFSVTPNSGDIVIAYNASGIYAL